ncbi:MAG: hypothetical protein ABEJ99_03865 [Candidatus Nanohaloarchaea archaeon]
MICVVSFLVFSILGIFSASHRQLAKESFRCIKNKTLREPCETDLEDRIRASLIGKLLEHSPRTARMLNDHFQLFSWMLLIILLASGIYSSYSLYNWVVYGNCNGPASTAGCTLNETASLYDKALNASKHLLGGVMR